MVVTAALDVVLGSRCAVCDAAGPVVCRGCRGQLRWVGRGSPVEGLDGLVALFDYGHGGRDVVAALKYRGRTSLARWLGAELAAAVASHLDELPASVTWAPTTRARRQRRGFDQSEVLARAVGRVLRVPVRSTLARVGTEHQTGRPRIERQESGPRFEIRSVPSGPILVVDDVVTTGATLLSARRALLGAGASGVAMACVSRVAAPGSGLQPRDVATHG